MRTYTPKRVDPRVTIEQDDSLDEGRAWAILKPGMRVSGYQTHAFTFGNAKEYRNKLARIEPCECNDCTHRLSQSH